jgi:parvulin-like peptidyl-prolyl isomerase
MSESEKKLQNSEAAEEKKADKKIGEPAVIVRPEQARAENRVVSKRRAEEEAAAKNRRQKIWIRVGVIAFVIVFAVLAIYESNMINRKLTAVEVGDTKYSVADFSFLYATTFYNYYNNLYSTYGDYTSYFLDTSKPLSEQQYSEDQTWEDFITDQTVATLTQLTALHNDGTANGFELPEEYQQDVEDEIAGIESQATSSGYAFDDYLIALYGRGVNESVVRKMTELYEYAAAYSENYSDNVEITDADIDARYNENPNDFDTVTYLSYYVSGATTEEITDSTAALAAAKEKADAIAAATSEEEFRALVTEKDEGEVSGNRYAAYSSTNTGYADWLFDTSRAAGDTYVYDGGTGYTVLYFQEHVTPKYNMVNVRQILVKPTETDDNGNYTDAGWEEAKTNAEKYLVDFNSNPSEETFKTLAAMYNEDTGSKDNNGLYENVYRGQMVETFDLWCFDAARQPGDIGLVKTDYGYHLIYFIGEGDSYYPTKVSSTIRSEAYASWIEELTSQYEAVEKPAMAKGRSL